MDLTSLAVLLLFWWILASYAVASAAKKNGMSEWTWFFWSIVVGPIFAVLLLLAYLLSYPQKQNASSAPAADANEGSVLNLR